MNENFKSHLNNLLSFNSVLDEPKPNCPFGLETRRAYDYFLSLAKSFGFETIDYDGYIGEVVYGTGEEIGIIGHLDIVPVGTGWSVNPLALTEKDGYYYGRGVSDDKGPLLSCLFALKELKDEGVEFNKKIRLIVGCNEESGWKDLDYLLQKTTLPEYGFSPDGNFPIGYAEKGVYPTIISIPKLKNFSGLSGGTAINAVCGFASVTPTINIEKSTLEKLSLQEKDGKIESVGITCHGSTPNLGKNALKPLFELFNLCGEKVENVYHYLFDDLSWINSLKSEQGETTLSPNLIEETDSEIKIKCDIRLPAPFTMEQLKERLDKTGLNYSTTETHPPMMAEKDGWFVQSLIKTYNNVMNANEVPQSLGGSTFARAFKKGVSFGPQFPFEDSVAHNADERIKIENFDKLHQIYKQTILELVKTK